MLMKDFKTKEEVKNRIVGLLKFYSEYGLPTKLIANTINEDFAKVMNTLCSNYNVFIYLDGWKSK